MKHPLAILFAALVAPLLPACSGGESPSTRSETDGAGTDDAAITLGVIPKSTGNEFWETVEDGARAAAEAQGVSIRWEGTVTETEIAEQNKIIENMINLGVDGIALAPLNRRAQKKMVQSAVDAGIPVVIFDSAVDGDAHSSFVATDNEKGGALGAEHLGELLGGNGKVMVMRFVQGTGSTEARAKGFIDTAAGLGLEVVADPYPDTGTVEGAKNVAVNTLEGFVSDGKLLLDGIFACNLIASLGIDSALEDLRKSGIEVNLSFVGFDTSEKLVKGVQEGRIDALVAQDPHQMGELAVETITAVVRGEAVPPVIDTGVALVTADALTNDPAIRALVGLK